MDYTTEEYNTILYLMGTFDENKTTNRKYTTNTGKAYKFKIIEDTDEDGEILNLLGYLIASKYRRKILKTLSENTYKTPKEISESTGIRINHISHVLKEMEKHKLIKCVTPQYRKGRLYTITETGTILKHKLIQKN